jgi:ZIP family zinc transporter
MIAHRPGRVRGSHAQMGQAAAWGLVAGASLVIGAWATYALRPRSGAVGLLMGFGSGVLISAVAYELVLDAFEGSDGGGWVAAGLGAGAFAFYLGDLEIDRRGGENRKDSAAAHDVANQQAIVLGTVLDGIPEGIVLGMSLIGGGGGSVAVIAAVFLSNLPEAAAATSGLESGGMPRARVYRMWVGIALLTCLASVIGFALFDTASPSTVAFTQAFAGGALLTMLADTMMPEAFEKGGRAVGLLTALGFAVSFALTQLG